MPSSTIESYPPSQTAAVVIRSTWLGLGNITAGAVDCWHSGVEGEVGSSLDLLLSGYCSQPFEYILHWSCGVRRWESGEFLEVGKG